MQHEGERVRKEEEPKAKTSALRTLTFSYLLFFVPCFFYLWLIVEPNLIYYGFGTLLPDAPSFATGWPFLRDSLGAPGGPVLYLFAFLSQGFCCSWLGAAIIVLAGLCLVELARRHLVRAGLARARLLAFLPALALFLVYSHYSHPLGICLAVSLGLLLSLIFERLPWRQPPTHAVVCCLFATAGLWLGGAGTLGIFLVVTILPEVIVHQRWATTAVALPGSIAITWALAEYVFLIPPREAFVLLTPFARFAMTGLNTFQQAQVLLLFLSVPLTVLVVSAGKSILDRRASKRVPLSPRAVERQKQKKGKGPRTDFGQQRRRLFSACRPLVSALPLGLLALGLYVGYEPLRKPYVLSNYYSRQKRWDKILELARHLPKGRTEPFVNHDILRALYHTGRLPYDMFQYPLLPEALMLTHEKKQTDLTEWKLSDLFLELGHVNMAQKLASELLVTKGRPGFVLEELGWINLIKGHPDTARVYWSALSQDLVYHARAQSLLRSLEHGFPPEQTAYLNRIRSYMRPEMGGVTGPEPVDEVLAALLRQNPHNKMAFEYLMACYLVTNRVDKIVENMGRLHDLGYARIPTLYEEAILIYHDLKEIPVDPAQFNISPETLRRWQVFTQITNAARPGDKQALIGSLVRDFGTSYFFYYIFGHVGVVK